MWGDESEAVAPIIWLYQTVDARKEEVFFPDLLITLRKHDECFAVVAVLLRTSTMAPHINVCRGKKETSHWDLYKLCYIYYMIYGAIP